MSYGPRPASTPGHRGRQGWPCGWLWEEREWMGVEPTEDVCSTPLNNFEDCGAHRDSSTPTA